MQNKMSMGPRVFGWFLALCLASAFALSAAPGGDSRLIQSADLGWRFHLGDLPEAKAAGFDDSAWRALDVPHDWSIEGNYAPTNATGDKAGWLPSGIGWYRRVVEMPAAWQGREVAVEFEGVYMNSDVYLNGTRVGGRPYGYSSFRCDLTAQIKTGRNVLAVRVDNSLEPSARWYHGCGIYGHVRLCVTDKLRILPGGVFVQTPEVNAQGALVKVGVELTNAAAAAAAEVKAEVLTLEGRSAAKAATKLDLAAGVAQIVPFDLRVPSPALWSLETPSLYNVRVRVLRQGTVIDEVTTAFGMRSLKFDANAGFFLNGRSLKLQGVCEHQGASPVGAAVPEALLERRLRQLKAMGCNAVRAAHNPQLPAFYDLCDRLGLLVMDEIFDGWHKKAEADYGGRFFAEWWQRDVTDWVRRDRNHPCVVLWSIGNETGHQDEHGIGRLIHTLDTSRPVTGGDVIEGVDVAGFNGRSAPNDAAVEKFHRENPTRPILMSEEPHTFQTRGFYRTVNEVFKSLDPLPDYAAPEVFSGGHSAYRSSYDNCGRRLLARNCWQRTAARPWMLGEFRWTGFDYLGEAAWAGAESLAREFNFGVIDLAGFPKDQYYLYQSLWTEEPMVHLLPHWTHPGLEGKTIPVVAYANADEVELFQDGKSLGRQKRSKLFECVWQVAYRPGELKALAYRAGKEVAAAIQRTAGAPARLEITTDNARLKADRRDLALVTLAVRDAEGTLAPQAENRVDLAFSGPVRWLGGENGDPVDITPQRESGRKVFAGLSRAFYAGKDGEAGDIAVTALAILGDGYFGDTGKVAIACGQVALRGALGKGAEEIHYTLDGSEPTLASPLYAQPVALNATTTVRAALFRDKQLLVATSGRFTQGARPVSPSAPAAKQNMGKAEDPTQEKAKKGKGKKRKD